MSLFTKYWQEFWPRDKKEPNPELQKRITRLFSIKPEHKDYSPTLKVICNDKNKVQRMKSVYENNLKEFNDESFFVEQKSFRNKLNLIAAGKTLEERLESIESRRFSTPNAVKKPNNVDAFESFMKLIIDSDKAYIDHMANLIDLYVKDFKNLPLFRLKNEEEVIKTQTRELFGPIEEIYEFHVMQFHPMLIVNADNMEAFAENLLMMTKSDSFNSYIVYAMDEVECQKRRDMYASFMKGISYIHNVDYDFQPIQQLAKYHLMIKDALRKMELNGKDVSIIRRAEIDFKRIMERIYDIRYESKIRSERTHYTITI